MKHKYFLIFVSVYLYLFLNCSFAQANLSNLVFGNGSAKISDTEHTLSFSVGQPLVGLSMNSEYISYTGFWYQAGQIITGVEANHNSLIPDYFELYQNYPNPFNPSTTIKFALPYDSRVKIQIFNLLGEVVSELINTEKKAGYHEVTFNAAGLASGCYFYIINAASIMEKGGFAEVKKLILLK